MKVAIDSGPLNSGHKVRGVGAYTRSLIDSMMALKQKDIQIEAVNFESADLSKYDLVHYPYFSLFQRTLPLKKVTRIVVTIHDLIPLVYPGHYPAGIKGSINFLMQKLALKNVDAVITDTETSKKDIVRFLDFNSDKVHVVYLAPRSIFRLITQDGKLKTIKEKYNLPNRFVLYVGDVNYNKNIPNLVEACELVGMPLVIVGKNALEIERMDLSHPELVHLKPVINKLKNIIRLGFVSDEDLVGIYNLATVYCFPSFYEGFGLSVLEAFACETPVVLGKTQALVEIAGGASLVADPKDPRDLAEKITQLVNNSDLRRQLIKKGKERLTNFSWKKTAGETLRVYNKVYEK